MEPLPRTDREHLEALLEGRQETAILDFKATFDPSNSKDRVELAKDLGAMLSTLGGHIVLGVDDKTGDLTGDLDDADVRKFDASTLRSQFKKWLPEPFDLRSDIHEFDEHRVVVLYIAPHRDGFAPFIANGQYNGDDGRSKTIFSAGEVFCRHGPSSERWNQHDFQTYRERVRDQERRRATEEFTTQLTTVLSESGRSSSVASGTASAFSWRLEPSAFVGAATELLRADDRVPIKLMMRGTRGDITRMTREPGEDPADLDLIFDRLTELAALGLILRDRELFQTSVEALVWAYNAIIDDDWGSPAPNLNVKAASYWMSIVIRVVALGGVSIRERDWWAVRLLADRRPRDDYEKTWLRHGLTMASRANLLVEAHGRTRSLIAFADDVTSRMPLIAQDTSNGSTNNLDSLCQFDFLACVAAQRQGWGWYPNFSAYASRRAEPAAVLLVTDSNLRTNLDVVSNDVLAQTLRDVSDTAESQGIRFGGWHGYNSKAVQTFLHENPAND